MPEVESVVQPTEVSAEAGAGDVAERRICYSGAKEGTQLNNI